MDQENQPVNKQTNDLQSGKRRGTIPLSQSQGPPQGLYQPNLSTLSIGDGDLSFSLSISEWVRFKFQKNICRFVATTYDSLQQLQILYKHNVKTNIKKLEANGVKVFHQIDVREMAKNNIKELLSSQQGFNRIIWNFPHAGFPQKSYGPGFEWQQSFHQKHIQIIDEFFRNCHLYLKKDGKILMAHKTVQPFSIWNIEGIAKKNNFSLEDKYPFQIQRYPGYQNRRGAGKNGAKRFPIEDAVQYIFTREKEQPQL